MSKQFWTSVARRARQWYVYAQILEMGLKDFMIKHGFAEESGESNQLERPAPKASAKTAGTKSTLPPLASKETSISSAPAVQVDSTKFDSYFNSLFERKNLPGPDYFELWKMMAKLRDRIADKPTRLSVAIDALTATTDKPLTKQHFVDTAKQYIEAVEKDRRDTDAEVKDIEAKELGNLRRDIESLNTSIVDSRKKILELQELCTTSESQIAQKEKQLADKEAELEANHRSYYAAADSAIQNIQSDIQLIETQLA